MPKAALLSTGLHLFVALALLLQAKHNPHRADSTPRASPVIVDFVVLGAKSAAPVIGPQAVRDAANAKDDATPNGAAPTLRKPPKPRVPKPNAAPKVPESNDSGQKVGPKVEPKVEPKALEHQAEDKAVPKVEPQPNTDIEPNTEPKALQQTSAPQPANAPTPAEDNASHSPNNSPGAAPAPNRPAAAAPAPQKSATQNAPQKPATPAQQKPATPAPQKPAPAKSATSNAKQKPAHAKSAAPRKPAPAKPSNATTPSVRAKTAAANKKPSKGAPKPSPTHGVVAGKVDLGKKGTAAKSVSDFLGKASGGGNSKAAPAETIGNELTGTEMDLLNQHMKRFWNMPSGHEKAYDIIVEIELFIKSDGSVDKAILVDRKRSDSDPEFRIAAESALRAVLDPECSPLPLPMDRYETWKHMIFVFDPREMCR
ncbi:MAG: hypothetical protein LBR89_04425 [Holosporales bacterium]|nr:hypothetical protein [Holosporales bacterium]